MTGGERFEVETANSRTALYDGEGSNSNTSSKKRYIYGAAIACCVVVVLALGLGLGLGLQSSSSDDQEETQVEGCLYFNEGRRSHVRDTRSARSRTKRWLKDAECPVLGEPECPEGFDEPPLLVVSMDGFRADYLKRGLTPTLQKMSECGVHAPYMRATFPTKTFPNHYTLVTGLFTESHGIIDNTMYDLEWSEQFVRGSTAFDGKWWGGEPMWLTSKWQDKKSATMFWPGSDANITGEYPNYCYIYDASVDYGDRINQVLDWLDLPPDERPSFITLYFDEPDGTGHQDGPFFSEMDDQLERMDGIIGDLLDGISERGLEKCINMIVLADHGMGELFCDSKEVHLDEYLDISQYYIYEGVTGRISSKYVEQEGEIVETPDGESPDATIAKLECQHYNTSKDYYVRFYDKKELPKRLHYANHRRIDDVVMELEDKWKVYSTRPFYCEMGNHGYDNTYKSMHALFMAYGPHFKQKLQIDPFDNIEVYNLMAEILGVTPAPNNGTRGRLHHILHNPSPLEERPAAEGQYVTCEFPDEEERDRRRNVSDCRCDNLEDLTNKTIEELDQRLNLTEEEIAFAHAVHLPYGVPELNTLSVNACVLTQHDYVMGYSSSHLMPMWSAFNLNKQEGLSVIDGHTRTDRHAEDCVRTDVRLSDTVLCSDYTDAEAGIIAAFLYPPGIGNTTEEQLDGHISSNLVPMFETFRTGIWQELLFVVEEYAEKYGSVKVVLGPVFDYNADGHADSVEEIDMFVGDGPVPLPSHYFLSVTRCNDVTSDCFNTTEVMSVVLLHSNVLSNCWDQRPFRYMQENVIRMTDVDSLTGLRFFPSVSDELQRILLSTHLTVGLWDRMSWMDLPEAETILGDAECPVGYNNEHPPLILISLDGFRPDYIQRNLTPTIERIRNRGVFPDYLRSVYPTMTFPNHYTISTGLYPESHGIIDNSMYDMDLNENFYLGSASSANPAWWGGEPIWNTLELNNKTAMTMFWPGSDVEIGGIRPTKYYAYDGDVPYHERVDISLEWLNGSEGVIPDFISLYFSNVDSAGHEGGPDSLLVDEALEYVDSYIKRFMDGLYRQHLHKCVNIIITSDHGMSDISCERVVVANDHLAPGTLDDVYMFVGTSSRIANEYTYGSPNYTHVPEDERVPYAEIVANLTCVNHNMSVFDKALLPKRHHYVRNDRIDDVVLVLKDTWQAERYEPWCDILGQHGWDPNFKNLQAYFSAYGPAFKQETTVSSFENLEIYNLMAWLTNVTAAPNNGTEGSLYHLIKYPPAVPDSAAAGTYESCEYPGDDDYQERSNNTDCSCGIVDISAADDRLNVDDVTKGVYEGLHLAHGVPGIDGGTVCMLHHADYVSGYSSDIYMPRWSVFNLTADQIGESPTVPDCLRPDVRLESSSLPNCSTYGNDTDLQQVFLFPPEFSSSAEAVTDTQVTSNVVPMWPAFRSGIWSDLMTLLTQWAVTYGSIQTVAGPLFDFDGDGLKDTDYNMTVGTSDVPVPSHYYVIMLRCDAGSCSDMNYNTQAFIIPHLTNITNCMPMNEYLQDNIARIRDIELLTGLEFLTAGHDETSKQLAIQKRSYIQDTWW